MEWTVWVIKVYGITTGSWITVLREGKETFPSRISQRFKISVSWDCVVAVVLCCTFSKWKGRFCVWNELVFVSESNTKHRNGFGQRQGGILHINWHKSPMPSVFSEGREARGGIQMCQLRCGALCGPKLFRRLPHKDELLRHRFDRPPYKQIKPRPQCE